MINNIAARTKNINFRIDKIKGIKPTLTYTLKINTIVILLIGKWETILLNFKQADKRRTKSIKLKSQSPNI